MRAYKAQNFYPFEGGIEEIDLPDIDAVYGADEAQLHGVAAEVHGRDAAARMLRRGDLLRDADLPLGRSEQ